MPTRIATIVALVFMSLAGWAWASTDLAGIWVLPPASQSGGGTVSVPDTSSPDFVVVVTHSRDGSQHKCQAHWLRGMIGTKFYFVNEFGRTLYIAKYPGDSNRVLVTEQDNKSYWQRQ